MPAMLFLGHAHSISSMGSLVLYLFLIGYQIKFVSIKRTVLIKKENKNPHLLVPKLFSQAEGLTKHGLTYQGA